MNRRTLLIVALLAAAPLAGHAQIGIGINIGVNAPPPPVRYEPPPEARGPDWLWVRGHWVWRGRWVWERGHWEHRHPGSEWVDAHWERSGGGWIWVDAHWSAPPPPPPVVYTPPPPPAPPPDYGPAPAAEVVVQSPPPAPYVEVIGRPPGPDYFWVGGRWAWQGRWVWIHGRFERHPHFHPGAAYVAGHWDHRGGGFVWIEGSWR